MLLKCVPHVKENSSRKVAPAYEVIEPPASEGVWNTSNSKKLRFTQQLSNVSSGIPSCEGEKGSKFPILSIWHQLVSGYMTGYLINPNINMVYLINYNYK